MQRLYMMGEGGALHESLQVLSMRRLAGAARKPVVIPEMDRRTALLGTLSITSCWLTLTYFPEDLNRIILPGRHTVVFEFYHSVVILLNAIWSLPPF